MTICLIYDIMTNVYMTDISIYSVHKITLYYCCYCYLKDGKHEGKRNNLPGAVYREWLDSRHTWPQPLLYIYLSVSSTKQCGATVMGMDLKLGSQVQAL